MSEQATSASIVNEIHRERLRQVEAEDWTSDHDDDAHADGELGLAAACYAAGLEIRALWHSRWIDAWPWAEGCNKRLKHNRRRQLVIAGALIVAEIERLDRMKEPGA